MNQFFKHAASALMSAVLAVSVLPAAKVSAVSDDTDPEVIVTFDISEEGVSIAENDDGTVPELTDISGNVGSSLRVPKVQLVKEGCIFNGWTDDGIRGLAPGEVFQFPDAEITVLKPVFSIEGDKNFHKVEYQIELEGKVYGKTEKPRNNYGTPGDFMTVSTMLMSNDKYKLFDYFIDGTYLLERGRHFVMPDRDVIVTPNWKKMYNLTYTAGDVDRIVGAENMYYTAMETDGVNLQKSDRSSRLGFKITGWRSSHDDQIYPPELQYTMPSEDVIMYAVWTPINYHFIFRTYDDTECAHITAKTDTSFIVPECTSVKPGYKFGGWDIEGTVYQPGDEFFVEGVIIGLGYTINPVWLKDDEPSTSSDVTLAGDANLDNVVDMSDSVMVMQAYLNPEKYGENGSSDDHIDPLGLKNADVDGKNGVDLNDALLIQKYALKIITKF